MLPIYVNTIKHLWDNTSVQTIDVIRKERKC